MGTDGWWRKAEQSRADSPFEEWAGLPDVGIAHAAFGRLGDVFLLKELLDGLGHHGHGVVDVRRLVLAVDQLEAEQACPIIDDYTQFFLVCFKIVNVISREAWLADRRGEGGEERKHTDVTDVKKPGQKGMWLTIVSTRQCRRSTYKQNSKRNKCTSNQTIMDYHNSLLHLL